MVVRIVLFSPIYVIVGRVDPFDARDFDTIAIIHSQKDRTAIFVLTDILSNPPHVALTIDNARALDLKVIHFGESNQIANFSFSGF